MLPLPENLSSSLFPYLANMCLAPSMYMMLNLSAGHSDEQDVVPHGGDKQ